MATYQQPNNDTRPRFLVARVVPALAKACRLHVDLPILGVLTWLCGGAKAPRRAIPTRELWRRVGQIVPESRSWTDRQRGNALGRLWRAGLVRCDVDGWWKPCWVEDAMVARIDLAVWDRTDLSPAAKRVHAVVGRRIEAGWSDAVEWIAGACGMSRARFGEAMRELERAGVLRSIGRLGSGTRRWRRWGTGAQSEGPVQDLRANGTPPTPTAVRPTIHHGHVPETRDGAGRGRTLALWARQPDDGRDLWAARVRAAAGHPDGLGMILDAVGVGEPVRFLTAAGRAGLARVRDRVLASLRMGQTSPATLAAWCLAQHARGLDRGRVAACLMATAGWSRGRRRTGCVEFGPFVKATGADRLLPDGPRARQVDRLTRAPLLTVGRVGGNDGPRMATLAYLLQQLDDAFASLPPAQRDRMRAGYLTRRTWLQSSLHPTEQRCRPSGTTCGRTAGSR